MSDSTPPAIDPFNLAVGQQIRYYRIIRELDQKDLGALIGYRRSHVSRMENGKSLIYLKTAVHIAKALGVALSDLTPDQHKLLIPDGVVPRKARKRIRRRS